MKILDCRNPQVERILCKEIANVKEIEAQVLEIVEGSANGAMLRYLITPANLTAPKSIRIISGSPSRK